MRQAFLSALLPTFILFFGAPAVGGAQEVTTNITSSGLGTEVPLELPLDGIYNITGGARPGGGLNLFHSFGDFTVGAGNIANFLNDSGLTTTNIIGRVTELGVAHTSYIYGTIRTTGFDVGDVPANLFLVNPNGFVFGPQGSLNVTGSVSFSTAEYLRLFDGINSANFYANPTNDALTNSVFAMAPLVNFGFLSPAAYGFLTAPDPSATITVQGSALQVLEGKSLSLVGGDITVQSGTLVDGTPQAASLLAPGGQINLLSVASTGEMLVPSFQTGPNINGSSFTTMGAVTLEGVFLDVSGQLGTDVNGNPIGGNSGTLLVRGGQLVMDASIILASTVGTVDGASKAVDIQVSQDVALTTGSAIFITSGPG
jgi:filamentous hemagglutinin family protein